MASQPLLEVDNLRTWFRTPQGLLRAVDGVSFSIAAGETVGLVGESGCGKTVTALSLLRLVDAPGRIEPGSRIVFEGRDLLALDEEAMRRVRGNRMAMVFQEPMSALNPVLTVGYQVAEVLRVHAGASRRLARERAIELLAMAGIPDAARHWRSYPHELSGGMRQRVLIAMALAMTPALLLADEPTTALDVTVQAQILELLSQLQERFGLSILLITHDMGVVAELCQRVLVMYAGQIVEEAPVAQLFAAPAHPYSQALLAAIPRLGSGNRRLATIPGTVPSPLGWPSGCRFRERCPHAWARCAAEEPPLYSLGVGRRARCHLVDEPQRRSPHA
jgi:peptide/nickel transport system ATP-binding protein